MKTLVPISLVTLALSLPGGNRLRAQEAKTSEYMQGAKATLEKLDHATEDEDQAEMRKRLAARTEKRQQVEKMEAQLAEAQARVQEAQDALPRFQERLATTFRGVDRSPGRTLLIRSTAPDPASQANLEEDLAVMSHIFDKTIDEMGGENPDIPRWE